MTRKEVEAATRWHLEHKKGIFYNGKRYSGISFTKEDFTIHAGTPDTMITFRYEEVEKIETVKVEEVRQMTIFTK